MATPKKGYWLENAQGKKERLPSVTTILGRFKESGGLMYWAHQQGLKGKELYEERDEAAECGTLAHEMVEKYINREDYMDVLDNVPEAKAVQALNAFQMFREWQDNNKIEIISEWQELQLMSHKHRYGGTPDAIGRNVDGQLILLDWKTSNAVYQDYLLQLAAYKVLWEETYPDRPITGGYYLCRFSKEFPDFSTHYFGELTMAEKMFLLLREAFSLDKVLKKRVK